MWDTVYRAMSRLLYLVVLCLVALVTPIVALWHVDADTAVLDAPNIQLALQPNTQFAIGSIQVSGHEFLAQPVTEWWRAVLVGTKTTYTITANSPCNYTALRWSPDGSSVALQWIDIDVGDFGTVSVNVTIDYVQEPYQHLQLRHTVHGSSQPDTTGLWSFTYSVAGLSSGANDTVIINDSYGARYTNPISSLADSFTRTYPSASAAYQFYAYYHQSPNDGQFPPQWPGLYVATHDPTASAKVFSYIPDKTTNTIGLQVELPTINSSLPFSQQGSPTASWPFVLAGFTGDWWDAAQLYRPFALSAPWTRHGPIKHRPRHLAYPHWFTNTTLWLNSGWSWKDIFNATQGDPAVVYDRISQLYERFNLPRLALHWYVFQQSNTFDADYPVFFPVKKEFNETVRKLQSLGVDVVPYINGRIFDMDLPKWTDDHAIDYAAKQTPAKLGLDLSIYKENYGNGVDQAAMCPHTDYWQSTISDIIDKLVNEYDVHGVYIDQIGAAAAQLCWDPTHNHNAGGGSSWVDGYVKMLEQSRGRIPTDRALVTESNAEPYMDQLQGQLTLTAFQYAATNDMEQNNGFVPVFTAVYGGYIIGFGAIYYTDELVNNTDLFNSRLANELVHGNQLGWFSVTSNDYEPKQGMFEYFMDPHYDAIVDYIQRLANTRANVLDYLVYGREMRPVGIVTVGSSDYDRRIYASEIGCPHPCRSVQATTVSYVTSTWLLSDNDSQSQSLLVLIVVPVVEISLSLQFTMNVADFGLSLPSPQQPVTVTQVFADGRRSVLGQYPGSRVVWQQKYMAGMTIVALLIDPQQQPASTARVARD